MSVSKERRKFLKQVVVTIGVTGSVATLGVVGARYKPSIIRNIRKSRTFVSRWLRVKAQKLENYSEPPEVVSIEEAQYREYIDSLGLSFFSASEVIGPHRNVRNGVQNQLPPAHLVKEIGDVLKIVDEVRSRLGVRGTLLSMYRSKTYNNAVGGAEFSQHMQNCAIDVSFNCSSDKAFAVVESMRSEGRFKGGIGWYENFIHIDTRGYNATWGKV